MAVSTVSPNNASVKFRGRAEQEMPLQEGSSSKTISKNISELHTGKTYERTKGKFGKEKADKQAVAIAMDEARKSRRKRKSHAMKRGLISETAAKEYL